MDRLSRLGRGPVIAAAVVGILAIGLLAYLLLGRGAAAPIPSPSQAGSPSATASTSLTPSPSPSPTEVARVPCPLNGLPVDDPSTLGKAAIAVQIDDHPLARPARNLSAADMVVEAPVEGDATRFSAIFLCRPTVGLTGPIRSARYYEVDLWQDLHVLPVGFGASSGALKRFAAAGMPYVNGITGAWPWFHRHGSYPVPHNLYGDMEALRAALGGGGPIDRLAARVKALRPPFTFDAAAVLPTGRPVHAFEIRTTRTWRFGWSWDAAAGLWDRQDAGKAIVDEVTGQPVTASHVVVQRVVEDIVYGDPDPGGSPRRYQHLVGHGDGTLYTAGQAIALKWSRPTAADGTTWTYADTGAPVILPPGIVWWEIVPVRAALTES